MIIIEVLERFVVIFAEFLYLSPALKKKKSCGEAGKVDHLCAFQPTPSCTFPAHVVLERLDCQGKQEPGL